MPAIVTIIQRTPVPTSIDCPQRLSGILKSYKPRVNVPVLRPSRVVNICQRLQSTGVHGITLSVPNIHTLHSNLQMPAGQAGFAALASKFCTIITEIPGEEILAMHTIYMRAPPALYETLRLAVDSELVRLKVEARSAISKAYIPESARFSTVKCCFEKASSADRTNMTCTARKVH